MIKANKAQMPVLAANYYVNAAVGLDTNDGLTASTPFKTINQALARLPQSVAYIGNVTIHLADGDYTGESVYIVQGVVLTGQLTIQGDSGVAANVKIKTLQLYNFLCIQTVIKNISFSYADKMLNTEAILGNLIIMGCTFTGNGSTGSSCGVFAQNCGYVQISNCIFNNCYVPIMADAGTVIRSLDNTGGGNAYSYQASNGALIIKTDLVQLGTTPYLLMSGGMITPDYFQQWYVPVFSNTYATPGNTNFIYMKDANGYVFVNGEFYKPSGGAPLPAYEVICTLPVGFRPGRQMSLMATAWGASGFTSGVDITASGSIQWNGYGTPTYSANTHITMFAIFKSIN